MAVTPVVTDLTDDNLTRLYRYLLEKRGACIVTANERVGRLKTLATFLWKRGIIPYGPTIQRMRAPRRSPKAWQVDEIRSLLANCYRFRGELEGIPACLWWRVLLTWLWGTGARISETLALRWDWVDLDAAVVHVPAEVRKGQAADKVYRLPPWLVIELRKIRGPRELVFPFPRSKSSMYHRWKKLLEWAKLPPDRRKNHKMRVSHATWTEALGGDAQRSLGHTSRATTEEHYIDPRIARGKQVDLPDVG